jgi:hypothetical protein
MSIKAVTLGNGSQQSFPTLFPGTSQKVAVTATSAQSAALGATTTLIRVAATQNMHLAFGANPTAVADGTNYYLPAGVTECIAVVSGTKIAAIRDSADGSLFITEAT